MNFKYNLLKLINIYIYILKLIIKLYKHKFTIIYLFIILCVIYEFIYNNIKLLTILSIILFILYIPYNYSFFQYIFFLFF